MKGNLVRAQVLAGAASVWLPACASTLQQGALLYRTWTHRKAWVSMELKGFLFPTYGDLTVQHHAALIPCYVTCSDQLLLECLQLFPPQMGPHPTSAASAKAYLQRWFGVQVSAGQHLPPQPQYHHTLLLFCSVGQSGASLCGVLLRRWLLSRIQ